MERALLDNILRNTWLLTRFFRIDAEIIGHAIADNQAEYVKTRPPATNRDRLSSCPPMRTSCPLAESTPLP